MSGEEFGERIGTRAQALGGGPTAIATAVAEELWHVVQRLDELERKVSEAEALLGRRL